MIPNSAARRQKRDAPRVDSEWRVRQNPLLAQAALDPIAAANESPTEELKMNDWKLDRRTLTRSAAAALAALTLAAAGPAAAQSVDKIHFLIPGGAGGGWDGTARGTGEALTKSGLLGQASYENMSGGGGGKAIGWLIANGERNHGTLMVNSTPIITRSITKVFPYSYRDLTPIAATIGDYGVLTVAADSPHKNFSDVLAAFKKNPRSVKVAGGSVKGDLDHLVAASVFKAAGVDPTKVAYIPYDAGGKALAGLLSGETQVLSTGLGEALEQAKAGQIRILGVTAPERVAGADDVPTFKEQGYDVEFVNWRGFFGPPNLPADEAKKYQDLLAAMYKQPAWEEVRSRNGWANIFKPGPDFISFLEQQEKAVRDLRADLGFSD